MEAVQYVLQQRAALLNVVLCVKEGFVCLSDVGLAEQVREGLDQVTGGRTGWRAPRG